MPRSLASENRYWTPSLEIGCIFLFLLSQALTSQHLINPRLQLERQQEGKEKKIAMEALAFGFFFQLICSQISLVLVKVSSTGGSVR